MTMKKLLLVEDAPLVRERLVALLGGVDGVRTVHTAATLAEASALLPLLQPDLMVLDLSLPDGNAMFHIAGFRRLAPHTEIAVLTNDVSAAVRTSCLRLGARWHFDKSGEYEQLISLVQQRSQRDSNEAPDEHTA